MEIYAEPYIKHEVEDFVKRKIRKSKNITWSGTELFEAYKKWCKEYNTLPKSRNEFYKVLEKYFSKTENRKITFLGVRLKQ